MCESKLVGKSLLHEVGHKCSSMCDVCTACWLKSIKQRKKFCLNCLEPMGEGIKVLMEKINFD